MAGLFGDQTSGIIKDNYGDNPLDTALRRRREKVAASKIGLIDTDDLQKDIEISNESTFADKKPRRF